VTVVAQVPLVGRDGELAVLRSFVAEAAAGRGGALVVTGAPGIGKSVLLDAAAQEAGDAGARVLRASGVEFEADIAFSGLNQLVLPLSQTAGALGPRRGKALSVAFGFDDAAVVERVAVADATVALVRRAAASQPLLLVVDDIMWLDRSSAFVLGFVARRLAESPAALIVASRPHEDSFFDRAGLPELALGALDDAEAVELLRPHSPGLVPAVVDRLVREAGGNPLALVELPRTLTAAQRWGTEPLPPVMRLTQRLHALFSPRVAALDAATRRLLLMAVLEGTGDVKILQAASEGPLALLDAAARAGLITLDADGRRLVFRHPLVQATVIELASAAERRRAHRALAHALGAEPERRAWHLAEAATGPDEQVAALVEEAAYRRLRRGDAVGAIAALIRAAELSPHGSDASRRLADAAYVGADVTGELGTASRLLADARQADREVGEGQSLHAAIASAFLLLNSDGEVDTAHQLLVAAIERAASRPERDDEGLIEALYTLSLVCHFGGRAELWDPFHAAVAGLGAAVPTVVRLLGQSYADPVSISAPALSEVDQVVSSLMQDDSDPSRSVRISVVAFYVDRLAGCRDPLRRLAREGRAGGAVGSVISATVMLAWDSLWAGRWGEVESLATEGVELCDAQGFRLLAWPGRYLQALLAAGRGDDDGCRALTDAMIEWAAPRGARRLIHYALHARALSALGREDFEDAYRDATSITPPGDLGSHDPQALWSALDLVEAAMHADRQAEAAAHAAALRDADVARISPRWALVAAGSGAIATPDHAVELFERALATSGGERWPFEQARIRLAFGEHLRRAGQARRARAELEAAVDTFERLGAKPWARRGSRELRATGRTRRRPQDRDAPLLTPQESQIAWLAAAGLTNKEIAERLYLSPRTVGGHLYRVFPKLGITSRAALRDSLQALAHEAESPPGERRAFE
jgi:DNA-binding CsgD family transcriptional regulator